MIAYKTRPQESEWHSLVAKASQFKPSEVDQKSIIGSCIVSGFYTSPVDTIEMIRDQMQDNPELIEKVIGIHNYKLIAV